MEKDDDTIKRGTPEYNQYLMGVAGGLTRYGSVCVTRVNVEMFKADLEERFGMLVRLEKHAKSGYTINIL